MLEVDERWKASGLPCKGLAVKSAFLYSRRCCCPRMVNACTEDDIPLKVNWLTCNEECCATIRTHHNGGGGKDSSSTECQDYFLAMLVRQVHLSG